MVRIAIVGLGYWGPNLLRNFLQVPGCTIVYGCDLRSEVRQKFATQYPSVRFTAHLEECLTDQSIDVVVIATPVHTHYALAKAALEHGKHVLIEKPMTSSVVEGEALVRLAHKCARLLMVDHTFIFTGAVQKMKELLTSGELGQVYYFDSERINLGLIQSDVNVIWDLAPHDLAIMNFLFEEHTPVSIHATGTKHVNGQVEEMAHVRVKFDSGVVGHIHVSWISPVKIRKILLGGSERMVLYNDIEPVEKLRVYDRGVSVDLSEETPFRPVYRSGDIHIPKLVETEALRAEAEHVIACIRGDESPRVPGQAGLSVVRMLEACTASLVSGREVTL